MMHLSEPKILTIRIQPFSYHCGRSLQSIPLPDSCHLLGIVRQENVILADSNPVIAEQDFVIAVAINSMFAPALMVCLKQSKSMHQ